MIQSHALGPPWDRIHDSSTVSEAQAILEKCLRMTLPDLTTNSCRFVAAMFFPVLLVSNEQQPRRKTAPCMSREPIQAVAIERDFFPR